ncbi:aminotransferase class III-fold pyridoxal phosphate-dependent enzyme [Mycolicibacterium setense]|uniref:aminotransferase class III-fold pyridoxal phosphate-dependent enzyme n=1 Tax=Mycolicibacterium setense TaxID=431269 RepID=UPI0005743850|nr:aminotransferase class III-fold pyridoxal phosphate-dependent enzyme [Mycolicibacterium setense]KHO17963.1 4-aminobutyrate aminotransferase [Mycolicibacterium setense]MCV7112184.1 aminotransferase class III-fold pyridoxal phosphate-dependent enzyme [Mycolicibacterium setense]
MRDSAAATYSRRLPIRPVEAVGSRLRDADGRWYIDCLAAAGAMSLGWNHPVVREAVIKTLESGEPWQSLDFHTPTRQRFVEDLLTILPPGLARDGRVHLCSPSGASAIEAALMLAEIATGGREHIGVQGGFHGCTRAARAASSGGGLRRQPVVLAPRATFLPYPQDYRCPFGVGGERGVDLAMAAVENLSRPHSGITSPASVLAEFVLGEGGVIPAPYRWGNALRDTASHFDVPLIADEVQAGMFRTGPAWAFQRCDIEPDMMVISKGLGSGLPIAVLVVRERYDVWEPGAFTGTFRGNAMAFAAASAVIRFAVETDLSDRVQTAGAAFLDGLKSVAAQSDIVGDVRGAGLMLGAEIVDPMLPRQHGAAAPDAERARFIQLACLQHGLIVETGGQYGNVVRFLPPLTIDEVDMSAALSAFEAAVRQVGRKHATDDVLMGAQ